MKTILRIFHKLMIEKPVGTILLLFLTLSMISIFTITPIGGAGTVNLPQTGQTKCYSETGAQISCAGTGQDGDVLAGVVWPNPRFTVSGDCVTDKLTGLMWVRNGNPPEAIFLSSWFEAVNYANNLTLCGYSDWRLPNVNELESLVHTGKPDNAAWLNTQGFFDVRLAPRSSTTVAEDKTQVWTVFMSYVTEGWVYPFHMLALPYPLPVRGVTSGNAKLWRTGQTESYAIGDDGDLQTGYAWPNPRFSDHGDGTVTDNLTGLMWTKDANSPGPTQCAPYTGLNQTWQDALDRAKCLNDNNYLGYNDWRLPNRKEIFSLIDHSVYDPALPQGHPFTNKPHIL